MFSKLVCRVLFGMAPFALLPLGACSNDSKVAGGTEAESIIAVQVKFADGTPAAHARIRILPGAFMSDGLDTTGWSETDESGYASFEKEPGLYTVEARQVKDSKAVGAVMDL